MNGRLVACDRRSKRADLRYYPPWDTAPWDDAIARNRVALLNDIQDWIHFPKEPGF
ncbi:MAG TPA: hypothetical protein V6D02_09560 [Candidatus Obscuribacterales bacterium]